MLHSRVGFWPCPQTLDQAGFACQGQILKLITNFVTYGRKFFITLAPGVNVIKHFSAVSYAFS
jgi:hypothetical protein